MRVQVHSLYALAVCRRPSHVEPLLDICHTRQLRLPMCSMIAMICSLHCSFCSLRPQHYSGTRQAEQATMSRYNQANPAYDSAPFEQAGYTHTGANYDSKYATSAGRGRLSIDHPTARS